MREVRLALLDEDLLLQHEVAYRHLALLDACQRAVAAIIGQPLRAANGCGREPPHRAELAGALAPEVADRAVRRGGLARELGVWVLRRLRAALEAAAVQ